MLTHALFARRGDDVPERRSIEVQGRVTESLPNALFRVETESGQQILAHVSTRMRIDLVRILPGDRVTVELSAYDQTRGRIVRRIGR